MSRRGSPSSRRGEVDATLLALAGLKRLGLAAKASALLDVEEFTPAPGQGAIAITARAGDARRRRRWRPFSTRRQGLRSPPSGPSCMSSTDRARRRSAPSRVWTAASLKLHAIVLKPDGSQSFEARVSGPPAEAAALGAAAGRDLLARIPADLFES